MGSSAFLFVGSLALSGRTCDWINVAGVMVVGLADVIRVGIGGSAVVGIGAGRLIGGEVTVTDGRLVWVDG